MYIFKNLISLLIVVNSPFVVASEIRCDSYTEKAIKQYGGNIDQFHKDCKQTQHSPKDPFGNHKIYYDLRNSGHDFSDVLLDAVDGKALGKLVVVKVKSSMTCQDPSTRDGRAVLTCWFDYGNVFHRVFVNDRGIRKKLMAQEEAVKPRWLLLRITNEKFAGDIIFEYVNGVFE